VPSLSALPGRPRAAGRLARSPQLAAALAARLTARDRWLLRMLCEHRVLTTGQITQLAFGTTRAATARLAVLYQYRAVDRFRPLAPSDSSPLHFILDEAGAMLLAAEDGVTPAELGYRRDRSMAIALSPRLAHDTGANGVFTALAAAARQRRPRRAGVLVGRAALRRRLGRVRPPRRVRPLDRAAPRPAGRHGRLLPRVRHRKRAAAPGHRQARRLRRPRRPHRHHHPRPVLAAQPEPGGGAARPAGRPAAARRPRRRLRRADPRRPRRDRRSRHRPRRPGRGGLAARREPRAAAAARPARPARHRPGRQRPGRRGTGRPALAPADPRSARLERPARRDPPRPGQR
jgi:Replication-relaxation